ncbi:hypothetical protein PARC_a0796 [Pseudoalteromonas arctica A 37-1-2]|uniref:Uncharacterized protein n=1 Tax=Pseudoalteromonas arctica A 37-1-2 TaxID=1117313 RepID=A0A290RZK6_9GAMM|nr:hypothetical protein PARC_a0796 [Pseudoalteromonas arctica A 37-1-2]
MINRFSIYLFKQYFAACLSKIGKQNHKYCFKHECEFSLNLRYYLFVLANQRTL